MHRLVPFALVQLVLGDCVVASLPSVEGALRSEWWRDHE